MFLRRSHFFIIIEKEINKSTSQIMQCNAMQCNTFLILPKGLFGINLQYEYKIMTETTDYKNNDLKLLLVIITRM